MDFIFEGPTEDTWITAFSNPVFHPKIKDFRHYKVGTTEVISFYDYNVPEIASLCSQSH